MTVYLALVAGLLAAGALLRFASPAVYANRQKAGDFRPCSPPWWENELWGCPDRTDGSVPVEPVNTYSNLAYYVAGWTVYLVQPSPESLVFGVVMTVQSLTSGIYHAVPGRLTAKIDFAGMYAMFLALTTYVIGGSVPVLWLAMTVAALAGAIVFAFAVPGPLHAIMGLLLYLCIVATWGAGGWALMLVSVACFVLAMGFWQLDRRRIWTGRYGHGAWHLLTAAAVALMYSAGG